MITFLCISKNNNEIEINVVAYHTDLHFHHLKCEENIKISKIIAFIRFAYKLFEFQNKYPLHFSTNKYTVLFKA